MSTLGEGKDTPFKGNEVSFNYSKKLLDEPQLVSNVDYRKLFEFMEGNLYDVFDMADLKKKMECTSCCCPECKCGKMKDLSSDNDKSACSCVKTKDEGNATCGDFGLLKLIKVFHHNGLDSAGGKNTLSIYNTTLKFCGLTLSCPEDFSEEYRKYQGRHDRAQKLYKLNDPSKKYLEKMRKEIHGACGKILLIRLIQSRGTQFANSTSPVVVICSLEAVYEAVEQEQAFIESHKKELLVGPKQGFSGDHFFYAALNSVIKRAQRLNDYNLFRWLGKYYGVKVPPKN